VILVVTSLRLGASSEGTDKLSGEDTSIATEHTRVPALKRPRQGSWLISLTSLLFILLQSACTAVMAASGLRLLIGLGSLAAASFIPGFVFSIHTDKIRIPMMYRGFWVRSESLCRVENTIPASTTRVAMESPASHCQATPVGDDSNLAV
jgi:hypothetical protein